MYDHTLSIMKALWENSGIIIAFIFGGKIAAQSD